MQDLLEVDRQDNHLAGVPEAEQHVYQAGFAQARQPEQIGADQRVTVPLLDQPERGGRGHSRAQRRGDQWRGPADRGRLRHREHDGGHGDGNQHRATDVHATSVPLLP